MISICTYSDKIRDITNIQGIHDNELVGYGLVVGLNGTGDQNIQNPFTIQSLNNMLLQFGISIPSGSNVQIKNTASVIVTARLPPFNHQGQQIDVSVSSIGNARSLQGGTLLMTPLKGINNQICAIAQGHILVNNADNLNKNNEFTQNNLFNNGKIPKGATIEHEVPTDFGNQSTINLELNEEDFSLAQKISDVINMHYPDTAIALNSRTIQLNSSKDKTVQVRLLSKIQNLEIPIPIQNAKIIINSHTGSIVMNQEIHVSSCSVSNGYLSITVHKTDQEKLKELSNIGYYQNKSTKKDNTKIKSYNNKDCYKYVDLNNIIHTLNTLGINPSELTSILQSMQRAGCLHAKLEII